MANNIELSNEEIKTLIEWFQTTDYYYAERGASMLDEDHALLNKLQELIK